MLNIPKNYINPHYDLPFSAEIKKLGKVEKLVTSLKDKNEYVIHIKVSNRL